MQVIPAVDVLEGGVVRLQEGDFERRSLFGDNPVAMAERWVEEGADLVHVVDLNGARTGQPDPGLWTGFAEAGIPFQIGGGIRTIASARAAVEAGVQRVVLGTASIWNPELLGEIVGALGSHRVVAALDVRAGRALGEGWLDEGRELIQVMADLVSTGVQHLLVTSVNRDGMMQGPDLDLVVQISEAVPSMAVIASGGVASLDHLRALALTGARAVIVGRALYEGQFTYQEAAQVSRAAAPADANPAHSAVVVPSLTEDHQGEEA